MIQTKQVSAQGAQGEATALLVIDVQQGLFNKSTRIYQAEPLLETIEALIAQSHAAGAPVVYVQHASSKVLPYGSKDWQLHPRLQPGENDLVVHKQHGNAFEGTELHAELARRDVGRVIVTGLVTHGCVKATCEGALALGYAVVLARDGHSSYSKDAPRLIEEWNRKLGEAGVEVIPAGQIQITEHAYA